MLRRVVEFVAFWMLVAGITMLATAASAGELADRYASLKERGLLDEGLTGMVVAEEPRPVTLHALARLADDGKVEIEAIEDVDGEIGGLLVRMDIGSKGALWHAVFFTEDDNGRPMATIIWLARELPTQPA